MTPQERLASIKSLRRPEHMGQASFDWLIARVEQLQGAILNIEALTAIDHSAAANDLCLEALHTGPKPGGEE